MKDLALTTLSVYIDMFAEGKRLAGKKPKVFITDGAPNFHVAYKKEFFSHKENTLHICHIHLQGDMNNNKMERLNVEIRDREKVMRGLKKKDSPIIDGYRIYHNFIEVIWLLMERHLPILQVSRFIEITNGLR